MNIGGVLNPESWERWEEAKAYLEPARALGDPDDDLIRPDHALWVVMDGDELLAACTARITNFGCHVMWVGGKDHRRWIKELDEAIGKAARSAGAERMYAMGRRGWLKSLLRLGWAQFGADADGIVTYSRNLEE